MEGGEPSYLAYGGLHGFFINKGFTLYTYNINIFKNPGLGKMPERDFLY